MLWEQLFMESLMTLRLWKVMNGKITDQQSLIMLAQQLEQAKDGEDIITDFDIKMETIEIGDGPGMDIVIPYDFDRGKLIKFIVDFIQKECK